MKKMTKSYRLEKEYKKVLKGRKDQIRRMQKMGYDIDMSILPEKLPKRITEASIRSLRKKYSTDNLYKKAKYVDTTDDTLEIISGDKARIRRRWKKSTPKEYSTDVVKDAPLPPSPKEKPQIKKENIFSTDVVEEESLDEWDFLVDMIRGYIASIPYKPIPKYSRPVNSICSDAFEDFVRSVDDAHKPEVVEDLRRIGKDAILHYDLYESEQVGEAKVWGESLTQFADMINSKTLKDAASSLSDGSSEDLDDDDFVVFDEENAQPWMFFDM